jgi:cell division septation protein DedD
VPWPSNGDYYNFKEEAIKLHAPPVSGVYGIYNFKHHILIGQANNIREALLRHQKENKFRFRRLQPTGFTFEACPVEFKEFRVRELIWEYQPVIQPDETVGLAALWRSWTTPRARAFHAHAGPPKQPAENSRKPSAPTGAGEKRPASARVHRDQFALASSGFAFIIVAIALSVLLAENKTVAESWTRQLLSFAHNLTSSNEQRSPAVSLTPTPDTRAPDDATMPTTGTSAPAAESPTEQLIAGVIEGADDPTAPSTPPNASASIDKKSAAAPVVENELTKSQTVKREDSRRLWTVQASATTDKNDAKALLDHLKAKGYDAFIVEAEVKGHNWYRIRVGNLPSRQEAEVLGKTLQSKEGFRDAFIAQTTEADVILAWLHSQTAE